MTATAITMMAAAMRGFQTPACEYRKSTPVVRERAFCGHGHRWLEKIPGLPVIFPKNEVFSTSVGDEHARIPTVRTGGGYQSC